MSSAETERSFSCLRQIHSWLRTTMTEDRIGNIGVLAVHGFNVPLSIEKICDTFIIIQAGCRVDQFCLSICFV